MLSETSGVVKTQPIESKILLGEVILGEKPLSNAFRFPVNKNFC